MWKQPDTLPEKGDNERFIVYLAFDDRTVRLADWCSYTHIGSEYHSNGTYLGEYPQDGDSFYMTDCGHEVRKDSDDEDRWYATRCFADGTSEKFYVVGWTEALKPAPGWERAEVLPLDERGVPIAF